MAVLKVVGVAASFSALFAVGSVLLLSGIERSVGSAAPVVILGLGCVGLLFGAIIGATQVVVDAIAKK
jgi:hypothetical protein